MARQDYIYQRLLELSFTAETRELDVVEKEEEKLLEIELKELLGGHYEKYPECC